MSPLASGQLSVLARLDESAVLYGQDSRQADSYRSAYSARYRVGRQRGSGAWCISQVQVLGNQPGAK